MPTRLALRSLQVAAVVAATCSAVAPAPASAQVAFGSCDGAQPRVEVAADRVETCGFPAISDDGRRVAVVRMEQADMAGFEGETVDIFRVRDGQQLRTLPIVPFLEAQQRFDASAAMTPAYRRQLERRAEVISALLRRGGFRPMIPLDYDVEHEDWRRPGLRLAWRPGGSFVVRGEDGRTLFEEAASAPPVQSVPESSDGMSCENEERVGGVWSGPGGRAIVIELLHWIESDECGGYADDAYIVRRLLASVGASLRD